MNVRANGRGALRLLALSSLWQADLALSAPIAIDNPGFELPAVGPGVFDTDEAPPGWSGYGDLDFGGRTIGVLNPSGTTLYAEPVPEGSNVGVAFLLPSFGDDPAPAGLQQTLAATLQTSTDYTLTVEVGSIANDPNPPHNSFEFSGFPGYRIDLLAGTTVIATDTNTVAPADGFFETATLQVSIGDTHPNAGEALGIRLVNLDAAPGTEVNFDDVALDATPSDACPEMLPGTCKEPLPGKGKLVLSTKSGAPEKSKMSWTWRGEETTAFDLGDPTDASVYRLCGYDGSDAVILDLRIPAGGTCGGKPCWKATKAGFNYKDRDAAADGASTAKLKAGGDGRASVRVQGKGESLVLPDLPLTLAPDGVRVVFLNEEADACWDATFSAALGDPMSTVKWQAKND